MKIIVLLDNRGIKKPKTVQKVPIDQLKLIQAEFENTLKRVEKEKENFIDYASQSLVMKLLPLLDDFERALKMAQKSKEKELTKI